MGLGDSGFEFKQTGIIRLGLCEIPPGEMGVGPAGIGLHIPGIDLHCAIEILDRGILLAQLPASPEETETDRPPDPSSAAGEE